jgi:cytochrome c-type biogenesis protein CcmH
MLSFFLVASLITICSIIWLIRPFLRTPDADSYERQAQNIHFAKQRLLELRQQLENSNISNEDYQALKVEIETTLARDIDISDKSEESIAESPTASNKAIIALLICLIPLASFGVYQFLVASGQLDSEMRMGNTPSNTVPTIRGDEIQAMVSSLEQRLQSSPNDPEGWRMLARSYSVLGRYQDAINAQLKLLELSGENPDIYAALADNSALLAGGTMAGQPTEYVQKALQLKPDHAQSLWLAGLAEAQLGNGQQARNYWNNLLPLLANNPAQQQELSSIIQQSIDYENSIIPKTSESIPNGEQVSQTQIEATEPTSTEVSNSTTVTGADSGLTVNVSLAESLMEQLSPNLSPNYSVFVYARAKAGPPAPLAVKKLTLSDLPVTIQLNDKDAMMDQFRLSLHEDVIISARVSLSGNPIAQAGDFQSQLLETKNTNMEILNLIISTEIK